MINRLEYLAGTDPRAADNAMRITGFQILGRDVRFWFASVMGKTYRLDWTENLRAGSWHTLVDRVSGTGDLVEVWDRAGAAHRMRIYRIALLP